MDVTVKLNIKKLKKMLLPVKERNKQIVKAYAQHMIAKVLGLSQPADYGMIKRSGK